ncbi:hypothetical protein AMS68_000915 [Peltaster fructicola]|uniref:Sodium/calcium exchanger membrane region domain-containing protein n=1 Tax=Peltaster fructicola TaxID=286661 RepID=A0A6H0XL87_9PEZI|nr:hypothetical protein AMS68_000915 [Peltaster fructicola]
MAPTDSRQDNSRNAEASSSSSHARTPTNETSQDTDIASNGGSINVSQETPTPASMSISRSSLQPDSVRRQRPRPIDYGTVQSSTSVVRAQGALPRRPSTVRRTPSTAPHRGQEFSIDDDPNEVDLDLKARQNTKENTQRERPARNRENTLRRRPTVQPPVLARVDSEDAVAGSYSQLASASGNDVRSEAREEISTEPSSEETLHDEEEEDTAEEETPNEDDADLSDAESFTLKDRQEAINETHPFGIRIWKPALYKKNRSVQRNAEGDIHSAPGGNVSRWLWVFNCLWTIIFGWWLALVAFAGGLVCGILSVFRLPGCSDYGRVLMELAFYLFYPFGKYVKLEHEDAYLDEDQGEGRSISEYERWQTGDLEEGRLFFGPTDINRSIIGRRREEVEDAPTSETDSLLGRHDRNSASVRARAKTKRRLFGRGNWNIGRVIFFLSFYFLITPLLFLVSAICWFFVFTIPMGKVTLLLFYHLRRHPLALSFHTDSTYTRSASRSSILVCTYRAVGLKYWKYTIDGTNIFLINLLGLVAFTIFDYFVLYETFHVDTWLTSPGFNFLLGILSIIPLAYFIGQAVASISAQSSMGVGATINAFFSTIVEVFLYCVALSQGKSQLVEGSIVGSIFAGILFLPGISMCFGALKRKTQRFNVRSAGVTNTMLLFAVIGAFGPTLFYQIYGSHELNCHQCTHHSSADRDCRRCYFSQIPAINTRFFEEAVKPYVWISAILLFLSYIVGLLFTLRTHASVIWNNEPDEKKDVKLDQSAARLEAERHALVASTASLDTRSPVANDNIRDTQIYRRILNQSLRQAGVAPQLTKKGDTPKDGKTDQTGAPHIVPPKSSDGEQGSQPSGKIHGLSEADNRVLVQQVAEIAATAAAVAARDATKAPRLTSRMSTTGTIKTMAKTGTSQHNGSIDAATNGEVATAVDLAGPDAAGPGGHDAPNWSRTKSAVILLTATVAYAVIAEILVDTVDAVLENVSVDQKFLGITLFALVPNTTEFLNAISFAMNGNIALSMEIGNSYALQVMLLQIPALILYSAITGSWSDGDAVLTHTFSMIFPQWDMVTVILGVFLMGYVVGEGKSNYFKGSSLILTYLVFVVGFWFSGYNNLNTMGVDPNDTLAVSSQVEKYWTTGRGSSGMAFLAR